MTSKRMMEIVSSVFFGTGETIEMDDRREAFAKLKKEMGLRCDCVSREEVLESFNDWASGLFKTDETECAIDVWDVESFVETIKEMPGKPVVPTQWGAVNIGGVDLDDWKKNAMECCAANEDDVLQELQEKGFYQTGMGETAVPVEVVIKAVGEYVGELDDLYEQLNADDKDSFAKENAIVDFVSGVKTLHGIMTKGILDVTGQSKELDAEGKPVLRPMQWMTEECCSEWCKTLDGVIEHYDALYDKYAAGVEMNEALAVDTMHCLDLFKELRAYRHAWLEMRKSVEKILLDAAADVKHNEEVVLKLSEVYCAVRDAYPWKSEKRWEEKAEYEKQEAERNQRMTGDLV